MFNKDFYPTPEAVIAQMLAGIDIAGKIILEPSAGKGNIVDYCKAHGAAKVLACEKEPDLQKILASKCTLIEPDFLKLTAERISHLQLIVMNPPFSADEKHINHAWTIAPEGCEIIALCNWETINSPWTSQQRQLKRTIDDYGEKENLGNCFTEAERKTGVEVGLIKLFKPCISTDFDYEGFFLGPDEEEGQANSIMTYNEMRAIVNSYIGAVKCFDRVMDVCDEMNTLTKLTGFGNGFKFDASHGNNITTKEDFAREMQKHCWKYVFNKMNIDKYVTKGVMADINKFVESRKNYPFTMKNIYRMLEIIIGTREQIMNRAIVEAVDKFTMHTHENRYSLEGWKTNSGYMLNQKFISGWICEPNYRGGLGIKSWQGNFEYLVDLTKAICYITGTNYDDIDSIELSSAEKDSEGKYVKEKEYSDRIKGRNHFKANQWYSWGFFEFKVFKKGTGHFKFKDRKVWEMLNRAYAKIKGQVLPDNMKAAA